MLNNRIKKNFKSAAVIVLMVIAYAISFALCYQNFNNPTLFGLLIAFMLIESITVFLLIINTFKMLKRSKLVYYTMGAYTALLIIAFVIIFATLKNAKSGAEHTFYSIYIVYTLTSLFLIAYAVASVLTYKKRYNNDAIVSSETVMLEPAAIKTVKHNDNLKKSMPRRRYRKSKLSKNEVGNTIERFPGLNFNANSVRLISDNVSLCVEDGFESDNNICKNSDINAYNADNSDKTLNNDEKKSIINDGKVIIELINSKNTKRNKNKHVTTNRFDKELHNKPMNENAHDNNDAIKLQLNINDKNINNRSIERSSDDAKQQKTFQKDIVRQSKLNIVNNNTNANTDSLGKTFTSDKLIEKDSTVFKSNSIINVENCSSGMSEVTDCYNNQFNNANGVNEFSEETNIDLLDKNIDLTKINIEDIDITEDVIKSVEAGFDDVLAAVEEEIEHNYKPIAIDVYANDAELPDGIEIVENDFIATGKFADYNVKNETRGKYEEIENENERKIAKMTDLSKVIITTNYKATIVPIETEILPRIFENKLRMCDYTVKSYYNSIKNKLLSIEGMKSRISKAADTFKYNKEILAKITISGKTLLVSLNMPTAEYDAKYYKFTDESDKGRYAETPMQIRIKNNLTLKRALEMIDLMIKRKNCNTKKNYTMQDFAANYPYIDNAILYMNSIAHLIRRK